MTSGELVFSFRDACIQLTAKPSCTTILVIGRVCSYRRFLTIGVSLNELAAVKEGGWGGVKNRGL